MAAWADAIGGRSRAEGSTIRVCRTDSPTTTSRSRTRAGRFFQHLNRLGATDTGPQVGPLPTFDQDRRGVWV
jgi:hypothetical protein